ncbi:hypothetical protein N9K75_02125 [bacterium]|nr:hypothetical protein [bacterium]
MEELKLNDVTFYPKDYEGEIEIQIEEHSQDYGFYDISRFISKNNIPVLIEFLQKALEEK